ncbi:hypothetical protein P7M48_16395 [Vibrio parahaemolyticus]|nr:hypothetical protein [Vibrio parahaemolyticus]MDG2869294.1 hypothetical protein [Vibrio parahaemolyticus]
MKEGIDMGIFWGIIICGIVFLTMGRLKEEEDQEKLKKVGRLNSTASKTQSPVTRNTFDSTNANTSSVSTATAMTAGFLAASTLDNFGNNPATGLPMVNSLFDQGGNAWGDQPVGIASDPMLGVMEAPSTETCMVNPANGLVMVGTVFDIAGNIYGFDNTMRSDVFDDGFGSSVSSGSFGSDLFDDSFGSSMFEDGFGSGSDLFDDSFSSSLFDD